MRRRGRNTGRIKGNQRSCPAPPRQRNLRISPESHVPVPPDVLHNTRPGAAIPVIQATPRVSSSQARVKASSRQASYRPLRPPWPASISVFSSTSACPLAVARSLATHLAGSTKNTRVSFRLVIARIGGYSCAQSWLHGELGSLYSQHVRSSNGTLP